MMKEEGESRRPEDSRAVSIGNQNHSNQNSNQNGSHANNAHTHSDHRVGRGFQPLELELEDDRSDDSDYLETSLLPTFASKWDNVKPQVYFQRWVQLGYLSLLALMSDWICFSTAASPGPFKEAYGYSSASLIDLFLFVNVGSSFLVTDVVSKFGLQRSVKAASVLMGVGAWCRSVSFYLDRNYPIYVLGTILVGAAQPFFQCTPPLLSAHWFASDERATSTAVALNFNQIGIATAFLVGGQMGSTPAGLGNYFLLIAILCTIVAIGTLIQFQNKPPIPPSTSEMEKVRKGEHAEPPFLVSARSFFRTPGFCRPLVAFICSISITNIVGAFIHEVMERVDITKPLQVAMAGAVFEVAIVLGGIILGGYVDRTKAYKSVTLGCLAISLLLLIPLGLTEHKLGKEPVLMVLSLVLLGFFTGPIQPINAELAVDLTFPGDETAVESVQQIGGNLVSALLMPCAEWGARQDLQLFSKISWLASDMRGDVILLMMVTLFTYFYFSRFDSPLKRTIADRSTANNVNA